MDENRAIIGVAMLFGISILVRVMPAFIAFPFSERTRRHIETHLPVAVFVNLIIYCIYQETTAAFFPAIISIAAVFIFYKLLGLLGGVVAASILFTALGFYF